MKFRKKPVVIDAMLFDGTYESAYRIIKEFQMNSATYMATTRKLEIATIEGFITASEGDWVIQGVQKEHYPCRADIFDKTYERVLP